MKKIIILSLCFIACTMIPVSAEDTTSPYESWENGPSTDPSFFPIGVWLQSPGRASEYKAAGINVYVGLWKGPTGTQLADLRAVGMKTICDQNTVGLQYRKDTTIIGWMHGDEPDNAQSNGQGGYDPPILPEVIVSDYETIKNYDPSRPVYLNLGQGVAYDNYIGRGTRRGKLEDYPEYIKGSDIVSFDIYPVNSSYDEIEDNLWYVPKGVKRLREWGNGEKVVWNFIECTNIHNTTKPTPDQVRSEVWMSLIHGSRGILYFVHQFQPTFVEYALLKDQEMLDAVTALNHQILDLAPVLNSPTLDGAVSVVSSNENVPVDIMVKQHGDSVYLFAAAMRRTETSATFTINGIDLNEPVELIGEDRTIDIANGSFTDSFGSYGIHLYKMKESPVSVKNGFRPQGLRLHGNSPNPFNPETSISYSIPDGSVVKVMVYDITGRTIAVIQDGVVPQGNHTATWNGHDSSGKNVGSGIYLYKVAAGSHTGFGKMTLIR